MTKVTVFVIINGRRYGADSAMPLSYQDVADVAGFKSPTLPSMTMRVTGCEGRIVHPGESVTPVEGMIFNVADTSNA